MEMKANKEDTERFLEEHFQKFHENEHPTVRGQNEN